MRISDWSSDVCSSDLPGAYAGQRDRGTDRGTVSNFVCGRAIEHYAAMALMKRSPKMTANWALAMDHSRGGIFHSFSERRSEERRVGKECVSTGKSGWGAYH